VVAGIDARRAGVNMTIAITVITGILYIGYLIAFAVTDDYRYGLWAVLNLVMHYGYQLVQRQNKV
jgi:hypothetical protein